MTMTMLPSVHLRRVVPLEARPPGTKVLVVLSRGVVGHWSEVPGTAVLQACVPPVVGVKAEVALHLPVQRPSELVASENAPTVATHSKPIGQVVLGLAGQGLEVKVGDKWVASPLVIHAQHLVVGVRGDAVSRHQGN